MRDLSLSASPILFVRAILLSGDPTVRLCCSEKNDCPRDADWVDFRKKSIEAARLFGVDKSGEMINREKSTNFSCVVVVIASN